jgi:glutaredoxin 2
MPREPRSDDDDVSWNGVREMIRQYDQEIIMPREVAMIMADTGKHQANHEANQAWLRRLDEGMSNFKDEVKEQLHAIVKTFDKKIDSIQEKVDDLVTVISQWQGAVKVIGIIVISLLIPIFIMVLGLFFDFMKWGIANGWHWKP